MLHRLMLFLSEFHTDTLTNRVRDDSWYDKAKSKGLGAHFLTMTRWFKPRWVCRSCFLFTWSL